MANAMTQPYSRIWGACVLALALVSCSRAPQQPPDLGTPILNRIGVAGDKKDIAELRSMAGEVERAGATARNIYGVALYYADPRDERREFVDTFPTDPRGIGHDFYEVLPRVAHFGRWYPYEQLVSIARTGDHDAIKKLLRATSNSDGIIAEIFGDGVTSVSAAYPASTLSILGSLPRAIGDRVALSGYPWCYRNVKILGVQAQTQRQRVLQKEVAISRRRCLM